MKPLRKFIYRFMQGANIVSILAMLVVGYSDRIDPSAHATLASLGLGFPVVLLVNVGFLVFWAFFRLRGVWLPVLGFILCFQPVRTYCPINFPSDPPKDALKVLSYNVWLFHSWDSLENRRILDYIIEQKADIVCLQEASMDSGHKMDSYEILCSHYAHSDSTRVATGDVLYAFSRYPILHKEHVAYESKSNHSSAFYLKVGRDTVLLLNNHFESIGYSEDEKKEISEIVGGDMKGDTVETKSEQYFAKLTAATRRRAPQARAVEAYIEEHSQYPIILCGDFNDSPISYTHHRLASVLTDCHTATAFGPGISYHRKNMYVRIDNILCSRHFTPYACRVDRSIDASDHYPISCYLKLTSYR